MLQSFSTVSHFEAFIAAHRRHLLHTLSYLLLFAFVMSVNGSAQAQREKNFETFRAGGSSASLIAYYPEDLSESLLIREVVQEAMDTYQSMFSPSRFGTFDALVNVDVFSSGEESSSLTGPESWVQAALVSPFETELSDLITTHPFTGTEVCYIQVSTGYPHDKLSFEIGHEVARCFLAAYLPDLDTNYGSADAWLVEGVAEWLASVAFPEYASDAVLDRITPDEIRALGERNRSFIGTAPPEYLGYGSFYFWLFLATHEGDPLTPPGLDDDVMNVILNVPDRVYDEESFEAHLDETLEDAPKMMRNFGLALATGALPAQPDPEDLFDWRVMAGLPDTETVGITEDFSLWFKAFDIFSESPAVEVSLADFPEETTTSVNVSVDELVYQPLEPGAPVTFCKEENELVIFSMISRANEDDDSVFDLNFEPVEDTDECDESAPPLMRDEPEEDSTCFVGTFEAVDIPTEEVAATLGGMADASDIGVGSIVFTLDEAGHFTHVADEFTVNMNTSGMDVRVTINLAVSGTMELESEDGETFTIGNFDYAFDSISAMTEIAGQVLDVSDLARDLVNDAGTGMFQPPIKLVCTGAGLDYHVVVSGQESIWTYWRQVP